MVFVSAEDRHHDLPIWLWLWFPPILLIVQLLWRAYDHEAYWRLVEYERGLVELATPMVLALAVFAGVSLWRYRDKIPQRWLRGWLVLVTLGCVYFAGEEVSWGQHLVGWETPEYMETVNDQKETNIHNMSSWFDQKPRLALEVWVLLGGIVYPLITWRRKAAGGTARWQTWFWPTRVILPTAVLAIVVRIPERIKPMLDVTSWPLEIRYSETQEYYFGLFLALYLLSIATRVKSGGGG